jgi:hypothetical protein
MRNDFGCGWRVDNIHDDGRIQPERNNEMKTRHDRLGAYDNSGLDFQLPTKLEEDIDFFNSIGITFSPLNETALSTAMSGRKPEKTLTCSTTSCPAGQAQSLHVHVEKAPEDFKLGVTQYNTKMPTN